MEHAINYSVTLEKLDQNQFINWMNENPRYRITASNGTNSQEDTLPDGEIQIMVVGRGSMDTAIHRHVIMRYKYTHISFYPNYTNKALFTSSLDGEFKVTRDQIELCDSDPFYKIFRLNINSENNAERSQVTASLNKYFGVTSAVQNNDATSATHHDLQWTIPNVKNVMWNFESMIFTLRGIGCLVKKADCTNVVVGALRTAGLTTPLNTMPTMLRIAPNTLSALCLLYLIAHASNYTVTSQEHGITQTFVVSFELLTCIFYTVTVYCQPIKSVSHRQTLPTPSDDVRVENSSSLSRYYCLFQHKVHRNTYASILLMTMSLIFLALDILIDATNGRKIETTHSRRDGILLSNIPLITAITRVPVATRCLLFLETVVTALQNNPQYPKEFSRLLERVATVPTEGYRQQEQKRELISFESPFSGAHIQSHMAYLVDASRGPGRILGGHAFLLIEGVDDNKYIIERIEIFANKNDSSQHNLPLNIVKSALDFSGIYRIKPTVSLPDGLVSTVKYDSVISNIENGHLIIDAANKAKLKSWNSGNYIPYMLNDDQFRNLRRSFRIEQIKFAHAHTEAMSIIEKNEELRAEFVNNFTTKQNQFIKKNIPRYIFTQMPTDAIFFYWAENVRIALNFDANNFENLEFEDLNKKHSQASAYLSLVSNSIFRNKQGERSSENSSHQGLFASLLFKLQYMRDEYNQCLLPQGIFRFALSGPDSGFRGNSEPGKPNNCLSWSKSLLQKVDINVVAHNKPKKLGTSLFALKWSPR